MQQPRVLHPGDKWHGFDNIPPGIGEDGKLEESGVPTALVNAWFNRFGCGIDFQVMLLPAA